MVYSFKSGLLSSALALLLCGNTVNAQSAKQMAGSDSLRHTIIRNVVAKLTKNHYSPKPIDDQFGEQVWNGFMNSLDPARNIFLQSDIDQLSAFKTQVDDELKTGSTAFFDAAWKLYSMRFRESKAYIERRLTQAFDLSKGATLQTDRRQSKYPANTAEKEMLWHDFLQFGMLKNYGDLETSSKADTAQERKTRKKVSGWYRRYFLKEEKPAAINDKFALYVNAITLAMDPHSIYTYPQTEDKLTTMLTGKYYGIGMELGILETDVFVKRLVPEGSAFKSGLIKENDRILAIADNSGRLVPAEELEAQEIAGLVRGEKGTEVTMMVKQPGEAERKVSIKREEITDNPNKAKSAVVVNNGKKIGYIFLPVFYMHPTDERLPGSSADIAMELQKLRDQEVEGLVFDLRGNGGGSLIEIVRMAASFMPASPISILRTTDSLQVYTSPGATSRYSGPLAVLIDEGSASASEMFSAAIQDYKRGIIIGTSSSYGKGTAQANRPMGKMGDISKGIPDVSYGSIRLTEQKFYRANGTTTQLRGVIPDVVLTEMNNLNVIREKDLPAALPSDTIAISGFRPLDTYIDFPQVIAKAKQRSASDKNLQQLNAQMQRLRALQQQPVPLELQGYRKLQQQIKDCMNAIREAKESAKGMELKASLFLNINPELQLGNPGQQQTYNNWLQQLSKDLFLYEAVQLVQDMMNAPQK